jgi:hypothetical protein
MSAKKAYVGMMVYIQELYYILPETLVCDLIESIPLGLCEKSKSQNNIKKKE